MRYMTCVAMTILFGILGVVFSANAQQITVDLRKIDPKLAAQILETQQKPADTPIVTVEHAKEWADIGENVGKAIASTAKALGTEVNEFVKTPVGKWAFLLVIWHVIGYKIWTIVGGAIIWIVLGTVIWRSFRIFHIPHREIVKDTNEKEQTKFVSYNFKSDEAKVFSAVAHALVFVIFSVIMIVKIL